MSVKIRVSYTEDEELFRVIQLLSPMLKYWKVAKKQEGVYKRAYIVLNHEQSPSEQQGEMNN